MSERELQSKRERKKRKRKQAKRRRYAAYDPLSDVVLSRHQHLITGVSETTAWRLRRRGKFPAPIKLTDGDNSPYVYLRSELISWRASRPRALPDRAA